MDAYCPRPKFRHICLMKTYINKIKRANCEVCKRLANHQFELHISSIHRIRVWPVLNTFDLQPYMFQIAKQKTKWVKLHNYILKLIEITFDSTNEIEKNTSQKQKIKQLLRYFTLSSSERLVSITILSLFSFHTIHQKSSIVLINGPRTMAILSYLYMCSFIQLWNQMRFSFINEHF